MSGLHRSRLTCKPLLILLALSCKSKDPTDAGTTSAAKQSPPASSVAKAVVERGAAPVPPPTFARQKLSDAPPPQKPSSAARAVGTGVFLEAVVAGGGAELVPGVDVIGELKVWDATDRVVADSTKESTPFTFAFELVPKDLRAELARLRVGAHLRVWLSPEAAAQFRNPKWPPNSDLRLELKILGSSQRPQPQERTIDGPLVPSFKPPMAGGPPETAKTSSTGVKHLWLASGAEGREPSAGDSLRLRVTAYSIEGVMVTRVIGDQSTALAFASAPAGLKSVLSRMVPGDTVRAWLPAALAREVVPQVSGAAVVDVTLVGYE